MNEPMDLTKPEPCNVCGVETRNGVTESPTDLNSFHHVCETCFESGAYDRWRKATIEVWDKSGLAFPTTGNFAKDRKTLLDAIRSNNRIAEGWCPNGCDRMYLVDPDNLYVAECRQCGFVFQTNAPLEFLKA